MMNDKALASRRRFLRQACTAGAVLAAASALSSLAPLTAFASSGGRKNGREATEQQTRLLMGTFVTLTAVTADTAAARGAFAAAFAEVERLVGIFDRRAGHSALSQLNRHGSLSGAPEELFLVLSEADRVAAATGEAFNPAIAPVVDLLATANAQGALPTFTDAGVRDALALSAPARIVTSGAGLRLPRTGMRLTLDGIAKGFIADAASRALRRAGLVNHMVNAGGDIAVSGHSGAGKPWNIGVRYPGNAGALLGTAVIGSGGIATSGPYEQNYTRSGSRNHLISHLTGKSAEALSVTVRSSSAMRADALATALALVPPAEALRLVQGSDACLIVDNGGRRYSSAHW